MIVETVLLYRKFKNTIFVPQNVDTEVMAVISSTELRRDIAKLPDLANAEKVVVQRGKTETFVPSTHRHVLDTDLERAVTKDELLNGIRSDIRAMYASDIE